MNRLTSSREGSWVFGIALSFILYFPCRLAVLPLHPEHSDFVDSCFRALSLFCIVLPPSWALVADFFHPRFREAVYRLVVPIDGAKEDSESRGIAGWISFLSLTILLLILGLLAIDYVGHGEDVQPGTFGDFFGGVLNPLLTFFTFIALAVTMLMQRIQLRDARNDSAEASRVSNLQTFETTFFNLLNLHNAIVNALHFEPQKVLLPREERAQAHQRQQSQYPPIRLSATLPPAPAEGRAVFASVLQTMKRKTEEAGFLDGIVTPTDIYELIQVQHNYVLGHYFRNLYQVLSFVDSYAHRLSNGPIANEFLARKRYANMLRAQLSANELVVLFFNCSGYLVDEGEFRGLLNKYQFLEHMPVKYDAVQDELTVPQFDLSLLSSVFWYLSAVRHPDGWRPGAFGKNPEIQRYLDDQNTKVRTDLLEAWFT